MELVEDLGAKVNKCSYIDLGAKVNKYSYINEYINFFCNVGQDHPLTKNQVYSNDEFDLWPVYSGERLRASGPSCFFLKNCLII